MLYTPFFWGSIPVLHPSPHNLCPTCCHRQDYSHLHCRYSRSLTVPLPIHPNLLLNAPRPPPGELKLHFNLSQSPHQSHSGRLKFHLHLSQSPSRSLPVLLHFHFHISPSHPRYHSNLIDFHLHYVHFYSKFSLKSRCHFFLFDLLLF